MTTSSGAATRTIVLMRHAAAAASSGPDGARPLTPGGRTLARAQGTRLQERFPSGPVLASPALRCRETAEGVIAGRGGGGEAVVRTELGESASPSALLGLARDADDATILVGHQPNLAGLLADLLGPQVPPLSPGTALVMAETGGLWRIVSILPGS